MSKPEAKATPQIFTRDVERLLSMEDMWRHRRKPIPLNFDELAASPSASSSTNGQTNGIKDQKTLTVKDSFDLFIDRCVTTN
jgi:ubiquitin-like 1-activating enzyme E1 B